MRDSNNKNILVNKAAVSITSTLYDRRALDCTEDKPLVNSLNHLTFLASSSPKVREALANDGGLERLIDILYECKDPKNDKEKCTLSWKWILAFQCLVLVGTRGTEAIRKKVVEAGMIPIIATILDNYLYVTGLGSGPEFGNSNCNKRTREQILIKQIRERQNKMLYSHHYPSNNNNNLNNNTNNNNNNIRTFSSSSSATAVTDSLQQNVGDVNDNPLSSSNINQMLRNIGRLVEETNTTLDIAEDLIQQDLALQEQNLNSNSPSLISSAPLSDEMDQNIVERVSTNTSGSILSNTTIISDTENLLGDSNSDEKLHKLASNQQSGHSCFVNIDSIHNDSNMDTTQKKLMFLHFLNRLNNLDDVSDANFELKNYYYELIESCCSKNQLLHNQDVSNILFENIDNGGENLSFLSKVNLSKDNTHDCLHQAPREFENGILVPKEDDVIWSLQVLAFISKYTHLRYSLADTYVVHGLTLRDACDNDASLASGAPSLCQSKSDLDDMVVDEDPLFYQQQQQQQLLQQQHVLRQRRSQQHQYLSGRNNRRNTESGNNPDDDTSDDAIDIDEPFEYNSSSTLLVPPSNQPILPGLMIHQSMNNSTTVEKLPPSQYDFMFSEFNDVKSYSNKLEKAVNLQKLNLKLSRTFAKEHSLLRIKNKKVYDLKRKDYEQRWNYENFQEFEMNPENEFKSSYLDLDLYPTKRINIFPLVEQFTVKQSFTKDIVYWSQVIVRNSNRKDELKGGRKQCAHFYCGKWEDEPRQFAKCRRCKRAKYCSKECQANAWNFHRYWCNSGTSSSSVSTSSNQMTSVTTANPINAANAGNADENNNFSLPQQQQQQTQQPLPQQHHHHHHHHSQAHQQNHPHNDTNENDGGGRTSPDPLIPNNTSSTIASTSSAASQSLFDSASMVLANDTQSIISGDSMSTVETSITSASNLLGSSNLHSHMAQMANATVPPLPNPTTTVSSPLHPNINSIRNSLNTFATRVRVADVQRSIDVVDDSEQNNDDDMTM